MYQSRYNSNKDIPQKNFGLFVDISSGNYFDIKKSILDNKTYLAFSDDNGRSALHYIISNKDINNIDVFNLSNLVISYSAPVDIPDSQGIRPLHLAAERQNFKLVKRLMELGAEPNSRDSNNLTPLHYALLPTMTECTHKKTKTIGKSITTDMEFDDLYEDVFNKIKSDVIINGFIEHLLKTYEKNFDLIISSKLNVETEVDGYINKIIQQIITKIPKDRIPDKIIQLRNLINEKFYNTTFKKLEEDKDVHEPDDTSKEIFKITPKEILDSVPSYNPTKLKTMEDSLFLNINNLGTTINSLLSNIDTIIESEQLTDQKGGFINFLIGGEDGDDDVDVEDGEDGDDDVNTVISSIFKKKDPITMKDELFIYCTEIYSSLAIFVKVFNQDNINQYEKIRESQIDLLKIQYMIALCTKYLYYYANEFILILNDVDSVDKKELNKVNTDINNLNGIIKKIYQNLSSTEREFRVIINNKNINQTLKFINKFNNDFSDEIQQNISPLSNIFVTKLLFKEQNKKLDEELKTINIDFDIIESNRPYYENLISEYKIIALKNTKTLETNYYKNNSIEITKPKDSKLESIQEDEDDKEDEDEEVEEVEEVEEGEDEEVEEGEEDEGEYEGEGKEEELTEEEMDFIDGFILGNEEDELTEEQMNKYALRAVREDEYEKLLFGNEEMNKAMMEQYRTFNDEQQIALLDGAKKLAEEGDWGEQVGGVTNKYVISINETIGGNRKDIDSKLPILLLYEHMRIIRLQIIKLILKDADIKKSIDKIKENVSAEYSMNTEIIISRNVAKYITDIFNTTLNRLKTITVNKYIYEKFDKISSDINLKNIVGDIDFSESNILKASEELLSRSKDDLLLDITNVINESMETESKYLQYFSNPNSKISEDDHMFDYFNSDNKKVCYKIDERVISELISNGSDINARIRERVNPLIMAINLNNETLINSLLRSGANIRGKYTDAYKYTFDKLIDVIRISPLSNIGDYYFKIEKYIKSSEKFPKSSPLIIPMTLYLLNHQIMTNAKKYPNMWSFEKQEKLNQLLQVKDTVFTIAKFNLNILSYDKSIYETLEQLQIKIIEYREILNRLSNSKSNLEKEKASTKNENRIEIINRDIRELASLIQNNSEKVESLISNYEEISNKLQKPDVVDINNLKEKIEKFSQYDSKIISLYDQILGGELSDYMRYQELWYKLFQEQTMIDEDFTQTPYILQKHIYENGVIDKDLFIGYNEILEFYDSILNKYKTDYLDMSEYLDDRVSNYALKEIFEIMQHVFKTTISFDYINQIAYFILENDKSKKPKEIYDSLVSSSFNSYVFDTLPGIIIKSITKISENEADIAEPDTLTILNYALDKLSLTISEDLKFNIINKINVFYADYMNLMVAEMHDVMVTQLKSFSHQNKLLRILKIMNSV
jgi:ankyrin repeat protein